MDNTDSARRVNRKNEAGWVTTAAVAVQLGCEEKTVRENIRKLKIPHKKFCNAILVQWDQMVNCIPYE